MSVKTADKPSPEVETLPMVEHRAALQRLAQDYEKKLKDAAVVANELREEIAQQRWDYGRLKGKYKIIKKALRLVAVKY